MFIQIVFVPKQAEIAAMISNVLPKLTEPLGDIKRLVDKFRVPGDMTRFDVLFSEDSTCKKIQRQLDAG